MTNDNKCGDQPPNKTPEPVGLITAIRETLDQSLIRKVEEQLSLLPTPGHEPAIQEHGGPGEAGRRGPGRPAGSRNKTTEDWRDYILSRYPSPLVFMAEAYSRPVQALAVELGCDKLEAFKVQVICAREAFPYLHARMATSDAGDDIQPIPIAFYLTEDGIKALGPDAVAPAGHKLVIDGRAEPVELPAETSKRGETGNDDNSKA